MVINIRFFRSVAVFLVLLSGNNCLAVTKLDSLKYALAEAFEDTAKVNLLLSIANELITDDKDQASIYALQGLSLAKELDAEKYQGECFLTLGTIESVNSNYLGSLQYFEEAKEIFLKINDKRNIARAYNELGIAYDYIGNYNKAIECYLVPLRIYKDLDYKNGIANAYNNIGVVYYYLGNNKEARRYFDLSLKLYTELNDDAGKGIEYNNIGNLYSDQGNFDRALEYYFKGLEIDTKLKDKSGQSVSLVNIGDIYVEQGKYEEAIVYLTKSYNAAKQVNDKWAMSNPLSGLGELYLKLGDYNKSIDYFNQSLDLAHEIGAKAESNEAYYSLSEAYKLMGDMTKAYEYMRLYSDSKDSLFDKETSKQLVDMQTKYETEKKERKIEMLNERQQKQSVMLWAVSGGVVLAFIIVLLLYNRNKIRQKANDLLQEQKLMLEQKNGEITDSINYAKRIQQAVLSNEKNVDLEIPPHFILFKPKDIVSGDFYWMYEKDDNWYFAVADCTGHGVPGAFMSMLGIAFLNDILNDFGIIPPAKVLKLLRQRIINELSQTGGDNDSKDGMDISVIKLNVKTLELEWAGANNPLYIVRDFEKQPIEVNSESNIFTSENSSRSILEVKADKQPVGYYTQMREFKNHRFQLLPDDHLILFSDGFADQFGGPKGKKYKYRTFKRVILDNLNGDLSRLQDTLEQEFYSWKGDMEQVDDICIACIRV